MESSARTRGRLSARRETSLYARLLLALVLAACKGATDDQDKHLKAPSVASSPSITPSPVPSHAEPEARPSSAPLHDPEQDALIATLDKGARGCLPPSWKLSPAAALADFSQY